jgi:DnaK suppressor protein
MTDTEHSTTEGAPSHLSPETIAQLKAMLEAERSDIMSDPANADVGTDLTDDPGTRLSEREEVEAINAVQRAQLAQVDQALARIERGDYGICEGCGVDIPVERLEAMPSASYCINCQARQAG